MLRYTLYVTDTPLKGRLTVEPRNLPTKSATFLLFSTFVENPLQINLFMQNKPKVKSAQINVSSFTTSKYVKMDTWLSGKNKPKTKPKQTQTNPNFEMPEMNVNSIITNYYEEKCGYGL